MRVVPRAVKVQRQKTAIRDLRKEVLRVVVPWRTKGAVALFFILLACPPVPVLESLSTNSCSLTRLSAWGPAKLVETALGRVGGNAWTTVIDKSLAWI